MQLNTVVLPAPFGPISAVMSPRRAVKERSLIATRPPKRMLRCSTLRIGATFESAAAEGAAPCSVAGSIATLIPDLAAPAGPAPFRRFARVQAPHRGVDRGRPTDRGL